MTCKFLLLLLINTLMYSRIYLTKPRRFHSGRCIHGVTEEAIMRHLLTHHPGANWTAMYTDSDTQLSILFVHYSE